MICTPYRCGPKHLEGGTQIEMTENHFLEELDSGCESVGVKDKREHAK